MTLHFDSPRSCVETVWTQLAGNFLLELTDGTADRIGTNKEQRVRNKVMSNNNLGLGFEDSR